MLHNRRYIGEYQYRDVVVPNGIPAIVPAKLFEQVQERAAANKKAPAKHKAEDEYLLTTKLFCGYCKCLITGESGTSHTMEVHRYYKCRGTRKGGTCKKKTIKKKWIEEVVRQPLTMELLNNAFSEVEEKTHQEITKLQNNVGNYENLHFDEQTLRFFGGKPSKEEYEEYANSLIEQEKQALKSIKNCYLIDVDNEFANERARALHLSFHPRATFGYSNQLHEECSVEVTPALRELFLKTDLCKRAVFECEKRSYGSFFIEELCAFYEDTNMFVGNRLIMETISHERMYDIYLNEEELNLFETFEGKEARNKAIIKKLIQE